MAAGKSPPRRPLVAPPRAERGLKYGDKDKGLMYGAVAPPRAERGLKWLNGAVFLNFARRSASRGAWIEIA